MPSALPATKTFAFSLFPNVAGKCLLRIPLPSKSSNTNCQNYGGMTYFSAPKKLRLWGGGGNKKIKKCTKFMQKWLPKCLGIFGARMCFFAWRGSPCGETVIRKTPTYLNATATVGLTRKKLDPFSDLPSGKRSHSDCWNDIPIFNRKYIHLQSRSIFQPAMLVYQSVNEKQ